MMVTIEKQRVISESCSSNKIGSTSLELVKFLVKPNKFNNLRDRLDLAWSLKNLSNRIEA
jgi:hypothetical protein